MNLYKDNNHISRSIDVCIEDGLLSIIEHDLKSTVFEQERIFETNEIDKVLMAFKATSTDELLQILRENYNTSDAFDRITMFLHNKVKHNYFSFIS